MVTGHPRWMMPGAMTLGKLRNERPSYFLALGGSLAASLQVHGHRKCQVGFPVAVTTSHLVVRAHPFPAACWNSLCRAGSPLVGRGLGGSPWTQPSS